MLSLCTRGVENLLKKSKEASELIIAEERVEDKKQTINKYYQSKQKQD